jgi:hypothetical protein
MASAYPPPNLKVPSTQSCSLTVLAIASAVNQDLLACIENCADNRVRIFYEEYVKRLIVKREGV